MSHEPNSSTIEPVRIDLTSQDVRTGSVRLPAKLDDWFAEGTLVAQDGETGESIDVELVAPRNLTGLAGFFAGHNLKANDAVMLFPDSGSLRLEPFVRRRPAGRGQQPPDEPGEVPGIPDAASDAGGAEALPAPETERPEPELDVPAAEPPSDPFARFSTFDDAETDDSLDFAAAAAPATAPDAEASDVAASQNPQADPGPWHAVARRGFGPPHKPGPVRQESPPLPGAGYRAMAAEQAEAAESPPETVPAGESPKIRQETLWQDVDRSAQSQIAGYLARPDLPTIIRASAVSAELGVSLEEVTEALTEQARRPDSRITQVRPDFYMLRRSSD